MELRFRVVFVIIIFIFSVVCIKLFFLQVLSFEDFIGIATKQRSVTRPIPALRGKIFASDGSPLVINQNTFGLFLEPKNILDRKKVVEVLSRELDIPMASISAKLENTSLLWIPIAHKLQEKKKQEIENYKLKGLGFEEESIRFYPEGSMAAHLLGFVGKNTSGEDKGYFGLEGYYDQQLRGRSGSLVQEIDPSGNPILSGQHVRIAAENGRDLKLYLDKTIQFVAQTSLAKGIEKYGAKGGSVIVMDPKTGGILAMSSYPSYDPMDFIDYPSEYYKNPSVSESYEPGSTFKVLVMGAAINEGKIQPDTKMDETGPVKIGGYEIQTWDQKYRGMVNMRDVLDHSSNVGMVFVAQKLEKDVFLRYIENLGFGKITGIDLQDETSPELRPKNKWYEIDYATAAFGQGIAVTPLQMVKAVSAIANKGAMMEPHIVKEIILYDGTKIGIVPKRVKQVYSPETASIISEMMVSAIDNGETNRIKPRGYRIAGKTGTAQIPIAGHYDRDKTIASFVGFAPVDDPAFVMLVTIKEPTSSPWGSETAAPIFFDIAAELFQYFGISPSG